MSPVDYQYAPWRKRGWRAAHCLVDEGRCGKPNVGQLPGPPAAAMFFYLIVGNKRVVIERETLFFEGINNHDIGHGKWVGGTNTIVPAQDGVQ